MDVSAYAPELNKFINSLPHPYPSILEIACGPGNLTKYVLGKIENVKILGIDLAPGMIELAKLNCPAAEFKVMDCRLIDSLPQKFDGVIVGFCLPYLNKNEASKLINDISDLLNDGGVVYLSTIEGSHTNSGLKKGTTGDEVFMYFYESGEIEDWLSQSGMQLLTKRRVSVINNSCQDTDLLLIAEKKNGNYQVRVWAAEQETK